MLTDPLLRFLVIPYPDFDPFALHWPVPVRWYGLSYVAGLLLGWLYIRRLVSNGRLWAGGTAPMTVDDVDSLLLWVMGGVVIGGRLFDVLGYNPAPFLKDPLEVFRLYHGGMSFHGGVIGVTIAISVFAWRHGIRPLPIGDVVCTAVPIGLFFGRIANFVNAELWGRVSNVPWAMVFPRRDNQPDPGLLPRHPSELYEAALEGLVLGTILWWLATRRDGFYREGYMTGVFFIGYALARSFCELYRVGDVTWFFRSDIITAGMLYCIPMVPVGIWLIRRARTVAPLSATAA